MAKNASKSIQSKLLLAFISSTVFILLVIGASIIFLNKAEKLTDVRDQIQSLNVQLLHIREIEQRFYVFESISDSFYIYGYDKLTKEYEAEFDELRSSLNALIHTNQLSNHQRNDLRQIDSLLLQYNLSFDNLKTSVFKRGFKNFGLEGSMREFAHQLEDENNSLRNVDLLMLRRHEKDFFLRSDLEYLNRFNARVAQVKEATAPTVNQNDLELLNQYSSAFNELVKLEQKIGLKDGSGYRGNLRSLSSAVVERFGVFSKDARKEILNRMEVIKSFYFLSIGISLLISIFLAFYLSNILASPIRGISRSIQKFDFDDVKAGNSISIETTTAEIQQLAISFNSLVGVLAEQIALVDEKGLEITRQNKKLKEYATELKSSNAVKDKFFSIISHDLKGPLGAMRSYLELLYNDMESYSKDEMRSMTFEMLKSVTQLTDLLENLLEWSRAQAGKVDFTPMDVTVAHAVDQNIELARNQSSQKKISLESRMEAPSLKAHVDPNMLSFILRNLISNAIKFTKPGGRVVVEAFQNNGVVEISVEDSGVGMSMEQKKQLFDPQKQVSSFGTHAEKGTGLGLLLCKEFVERNGGDIRINTEKDVGTKVSFTLPLARNN